MKIKYDGNNYYCRKCLHKLSTNYLEAYTQTSCECGEIFYKWMVIDALKDYINKQDKIIKSMNDCISYMACKNFMERIIK